MCFTASNKHYYHVCANSKSSYEQSDKFDSETESYKLSSVSYVCQNDPHAYQACGFSPKITRNSHFLCGGYFSPDRGHTGKQFVECQDDTCDDSDARENTSLSIMKKSTECNHICEEELCKDESYCNGFTYGVFCSNWRGNYLPTIAVCSGRASCENDDDEKDCDVTNTTEHTCLRFNDNLNERKENPLPIHNHTRCGVFDYDSGYTRPYCINLLDQTNCSDVERVGGHCFVINHMSTVSKYVTCHSPFKHTTKPTDICDDNLENECTSPSNIADCLVHKHQFCDGVNDCTDKSDEVNDICSRTTGSSFKCNRTFNDDKYMDIPVSWILDNQTDCLHAEDEVSKDRWIACGEKDNGTFRIVFGDRTCQVLLCPGRAGSQYVEFDLLCDGVSSCELESEICTISRDFPSINTSAVVENYSERNLCKLEEISQNTACHIREFYQPFGDIYGEKIMVNLPRSKVDCSRLFGEYYVFLSCMGMCLNSTCPLKNAPMYYDACPGQIPGRVYTLANNSYLSFVTLTEKGNYENTYFQCRNSRCVKFDKVCNLVDDCGDMSDEDKCSNHMTCKDTDNKPGVKKQLISLSQQCDGIFDCFDLSDECNLSCGKEILMNWLLKSSCLVLGPLAVIFNINTVIIVARSIQDCKTETMLFTKILIFFIGLGDFLIGVYLVGLSVFDTIIHGKEYCKRQAEWLSGYACSTLGVISTTGSQLSLFSMTMLSLMRMWGITKSSNFSLPTRINRGTNFKVLLILIAVLGASLASALTPLVPAFEDYFVQGLFYDPKYKLFIGFPNKIKHIKILKAYYKNETISADFTWAEIEEKVDGMFNQSYGSLNKSSVHFYGNDGVCFFKYFVRSDDPRRNRDTSATEGDIIDSKGNIIVWLMMGVNLFCVFVISLSYLIIRAKTEQSSESSSKNENPVISRENREMQKKIAIIIATDFACWVPFIIVSALHNLGLIDATNWYVTFAMLVLPLNSVINPLLYNNNFRKCLTKNCRCALTGCRKITSRFSSLQVAAAGRTVAVEMSAVDGQVITSDDTDPEVMVNTCAGMNDMKE